SRREWTRELPKRLGREQCVRLRRRGHYCWRLREALQRVSVAPHGGRATRESCGASAELLRRSAELLRVAVEIVIDIEQGIRVSGPGGVEDGRHCPQDAPQYSGRPDLIDLVGTILDPCRLLLHVWKQGASLHDGHCALDVVDRVQDLEHRADRHHAGA